MRFCDNGMMRDATPEEMRDLHKSVIVGEQAEHTRPLTAQEVTAMLISRQGNSLAADDNTALRMAEFYPVWGSGVSNAVGFKVQSGYGESCASRP